MIHRSFNVMMDQSNEDQFKAELYKKYEYVYSLSILIQLLRVMTGPYFHAFHEMTENFSQDKSGQDSLQGLHGFLLPNNLPQ